MIYVVDDDAAHLAFIRLALERAGYSVVTFTRATEALERLAADLGGMVGGTRPVIEAGWLEPRRQIGLSGRTVKPKLLITCGVSGSIQFVAGMSGADQIMAINIDPQAPIFKVAHTALVGDVCEIIPALLHKIETGA